MPTQPLVELQINASAFLSAQLLGLQARKLTFPAPIQIGDVQLIVDHVEFGANRLDHSVPVEEFIYHIELLYGKVFDRVDGRKVLIVQPITVFVADLADVLAHPNQPPSQLIPVQATIFVRLLYGVDAFGQDQLQSAFDRLEVGPLPPLPPGIDGATLEKQFDAFGAQLVPGTTTTIGLAGKATGASSAASIINTGISVDSGLTRIALRQELGTGSPQDPAIWQSFFQGDVPDHLQGAGYAIFLGASVIEGIFARQISAGLGSGSSGGFELVSGVGATYSNPGGVAQLLATFGGNVDTVLCTVWVDVSVGGVMTVDTPNVITLDVNLAFQPATTACTVTAAVLGVAVGLLANFVVPLGGLIIAPILGAMTGIAAVVFFSNNAGPGTLPVPDCTQPSDTHLICTRNVPAVATPLGKLNFQTLAALDDGIVMQGQLLAIPVGSPKLKIDPDPQLSYLPPIISCGELTGDEVKNFVANPQAFIGVIGGVSITAESLAPIFLLDAHIVNDPLGVFANALQSIGTQAPISLLIGAPFPGAAYFQNPYPCQILVSTTGGERLVSLAPPPPLTQADIDRMTAQLDSQIGSCFELVDNWFNFGVFNPQWLVDPGPGDRLVDHSYEVIINGLGDGEVATLVDFANQELVSGIATQGQSLRITAVVPPADVSEIGVIRGSAESGLGVGIERVIESVTSAVGLGGEPFRRGVGVAEQLIVRTAVIALPASARQLSAAYVDGAPCVVAVLDDRLLTFDLSNPVVPVPQLALTIPGVRGVFTLRESLVAFGEGGFFPVNASCAQPACCTCTGLAPVYGAASGVDVVYAVTDRGLEVLSTNFARLTVVPLDASGSLARVGNKLVAANRKGLEVFSVAHPKRPKRREGYELKGIRDLVKPFGGTGQHLLALVEHGRSKLFDFSRGDDPRVVEEYPQLPWYAGTARLGDLFMKLDSAATSIQVSFFGGSRLQ